MATGRDGVGGPGERGASAVEFAIVVLPLLMLLFGILEFGRVYSMQLQLQHAARSAARQMALHANDPAYVIGGLDIADLGRDTVEDVLGSSYVNDALSVTSMGCTATQPSRVAITNPAVHLAIPLPAGDFGTMAVSANAQMPCDV